MAQICLITVTPITSLHIIFTPQAHSQKGVSSPLPEHKPPKTDISAPSHIHLAPSPSKTCLRACYTLTIPSLMFIQYKSVIYKFPILRNSLIDTAACTGSNYYQSSAGVTWEKSRHRWEMEVGPSVAG